jgi:Mg-chelatase subunit ChlD
VGFIDFARSNSLEKDHFKLKFISTEDEIYPKFYKDEVGFTAVLPMPRFTEESISFLGYEFPNDVQSQRRIVRLFRATVYHLSAHALASKYDDYRDWGAAKNPLLCNYVTSLLEDLRINTFVGEWFPDRLSELAYACANALSRFRNIENVRIQATRIMASLMIYANTELKRFVSEKERSLVSELFGAMDIYKAAIRASLREEKEDIREEQFEAADRIYEAILEHGPLIEVPSIPFTEDLGPCSLFPQAKVGPQDSVDQLLDECLAGMGVSQAGEYRRTGRRAGRAEDLMVFESHFLEKEKERKILSRYEEPLLMSRFRSMAFPDQDYTGYIRAKSRCKKETNRLIETLLNAMNAYMEDIRKLYGVVDLADAIQVIASKSDREDIFLLDEKIQKSFAWAVLIDASTSMRHIRDYVLELGIVLAESAGKVLLDQNCWGIYAFNDSFYVIKDFTERYSTKVRSRLGGLKFRGMTYMPDALEMAGRMIGVRNEDTRIVVVISDGWPYGYPNIYTASGDAIKQLEAGDVVVIGIGAQSGRMEFMFGSNVAAFTLKDFVSKFGDMYVETSLNAD